MERHVSASDDPTGGVANASGATSIAAVLEALGTEGFAADLRPVAEGRVHCPACGHDSDAGSFEFVEFRRLEGASDPDEMLGIAALRCPICATGGALVLTYGPEVTDDDAAVLAALDRPPPPEPEMMVQERTPRPGRATG